MRPMSKKTWITIGIIVAIPVLAAGWWLGSPLFIDREVNEEFPLSANAEIPDDMTQEEVEKVMVDAANESSVQVEEPMPESEQATEPEAPAFPRVLSQGEFRDADDFHTGEGTATVYELEDGSRILRFEDFATVNGPDLRVLLVPEPDPQDRSDLAGYVELGALKGNIGDQNYEIPADLDISRFGSVMVYCNPFHVVFTVATLNAA